MKVKVMTGGVCPQQPSQSKGCPIPGLACTSILVLPQYGVQLVGGWVWHW